MTKQLVWMGTAVMVTVVALALLWQFRQVALYVLLSLALAAALRPLVRRPAGQSLAARLGLILLYLVALGSFLLLLAAGVGAAIRDIQELAQQVSAQDAWQQPAWLQGGLVQEFLDTRLPPPSQLFAALIGEQGELVLPVVLGFSQGVFSLLSGALVILFLSIYWSIGQNHFERLWLSLLPPGLRKQMRDIWQTVEVNLGVYIRRQTGQALLAGLLLGLGYWLLGSPYPALLALLGAVALLIPIVGPILAIIPPLVLGLLTSVPLSLLTAVYTLIVIVSLKWWTTSRLGHHVQVNPMLTIVILIALADAYGLLGILFAPPLAATCQILWSHLISHRAVSGAATQISDLKERQAHVWAAIQAMDEPPSPLVTSSMERLTQLMDKAEPTLSA
ncbi:MAG: AI-2E family transporter [Anaerolineae bacterium]|nr:AI-2E family transporter [Anaerolineae bacterium]